MTFVKYKNYKAETTVNTSTQTTNTSGVVVNGLSFEYTPGTNTSDVILEYSFYAEKISGVPFLWTEIEYSTDNGNSFTSTGEKHKMYGCSGPFNNFYVTYRNLCRISSWVGSRIIRVKVYEHNYTSSSTVADLHYISYLSEYVNTNYVIYSE